MSFKYRSEIQAQTTENNTLKHEERFCELLKKVKDKTIQFEGFQKYPVSWTQAT